MKDWLGTRYAEHANFCLDVTKGRALSCDPANPKRERKATDPEAYLTRGVMWEVGAGCPAAAEAAALGGVTWLVDISHGNSRSWSNICQSETGLF